MQLFLYDFIDSFSINETINALKDLPLDEQIELHINSPGGSVFDGFTLYNRLRQIDNQVTVHIDGMAGSIASVIAMAGDRVLISEAGSIMIHNSSIQTGGNKETLEKSAEVLQSIDELLIRIYQNKTGLRKREIIKLMQEEAVIFAKEALEMGFVDEITQPIKAVAFINLNDMNIKEKIKGLASMIVGDNLESEELNELAEQLNEKASQEAQGEIQKRADEDPKKALFAEYVPFKDFVEFKNQVLEFIASVVAHIEDQPTREQILKSIQENTNEELFKLLSEVKSNNKVPTAEDHRASLARNDGGFDLQKAKKYHFDSKKN